MLQGSEYVEEFLLLNANITLYAFVSKFRLKWVYQVSANGRRMSRRILGGQLTSKKNTCWKIPKNVVWTNWWTLRKLVGAGKNGRRTASSWRTEMERLRELHPGETGEGDRMIIKSSQHTKTGQPLIRRPFVVSKHTILGCPFLLWQCSSEYKDKIMITFVIPLDFWDLL